LFKTVKEHQVSIVVNILYTYKGVCVCSIFLFSAQCSDADGWVRR